MYLREIQGLRFVAALLVAVYHIWFARVSGGVDAFFVIAGFFIYRTLFKYGMPDGQAIIKYYQKTLARVLPSASIVIAVTCLMFYFLDTDSVWPAQIKSALAAVMFVENWWLAAESTDYLARDRVPSPFQQMWALSVQMQMYLIFPLLLMLVGKLSRGSESRVARLTFILFMIAFVYALLETWRNQPFAYFNTGARSWQFLFGALLAYALPYLRCPTSTAKLMGYTGLLVLTFFAALLPVGSLFPGLAALIPVLATSAIIIGASNGANVGLLNSHYIQMLGNISFTFYLWHWPLLILYWEMAGTFEAGFLPGVGIILLAALLAYVTYAWIEIPFRRSRLAALRPLFAIPVTMLLMIPPVILAGFWAIEYFQKRDHARDQLAAFHRNETVDTAFVPATVIGRSDVPRVYNDDCVIRSGGDEVKECVYGNQSGGVTVALVGGSHSAQWLPALEQVAKFSPELRIVTMLKGNCPLSLSSKTISLNDDCLDWSSAVIERLKYIRPDAVVTLLTTTRMYDTGTRDFVPPEFREVWAELEAFKVLALRDNARGDEDLLHCVDRLGAATADCQFKEDTSLTVGKDPATDLPAHVYPLDLTRRFCNNDVCPAVIDGILVYRDSSHITATFARSFGTDFLEALKSMRVLR